MVRQLNMRSILLKSTILHCELGTLLKIWKQSKYPSTDKRCKWYIHGFPRWHIGKECIRQHRSAPSSSSYVTSQARTLEWGCHFLLQGNLPPQGLNTCLPNWQADYFTADLPFYRSSKDILTLFLLLEERFSIFYH